MKDNASVRAELDAQRARVGQLVSAPTPVLPSLRKLSVQDDFRDVDSTALSMRGGRGAGGARRRDHPSTETRHDRHPCQERRDHCSAREHRLSGHRLGSSAFLSPIRPRKGLGHLRPPSRSLPGARIAVTLDPSPKPTPRSVMSKVILLSILFMSIALPARAARDKNAKKGLRKTILYMFLFNLFYLFSLLFLYGRF
jgi:hypothetical protein